MKRVFTAAAISAALCALAGCYIGKAEFKGEEMKMYPFFGTTAAPICPPTGQTSSPNGGFGFPQQGV